MFAALVLTPAARTARQEAPKVANFRRAGLFMAKERCPND